MWLTLMLCSIALCELIVCVLLPPGVDHIVQEIPLFLERLLLQPLLETADVALCTEIDSKDHAQSYLQFHGI